MSNMEAFRNTLVNFQRLLPASCSCSHCCHGPAFEWYRQVAEEMVNTHCWANYLLLKDDKMLHSKGLLQIQTVKTRDGHTFQAGWQLTSLKRLRESNGIVSESTVDVPLTVDAVQAWQRLRQLASTNIDTLQSRQARDAWFKDALLAVEVRHLQRAAAVHYLAGQKASYLHLHTAAMHVAVCARP